MNLFKRILSGTTAIAVIVTFLNGGIMPLQKQETNFTVCAEERVTSGMCGENLAWKLDDEGTLTISGTGEMTNWDINNHSPWDSNKEIKNVVIQNGVTSIGNWAFVYCTNLTSITIPNSVVNIGDRTFSDCQKLSSISIPNSVKNIGNRTFKSCISLNNIEVSKNNPNYASIDGILFSKDKTQL